MSEPRQLLGPGLLSFCRNSIGRTVISIPLLLGSLEYVVQQLAQQQAVIIVKKINNNNVLFSSSIPVARNPFCVLDEVKKTPYGVFRGQIIISGGYQLHYNYLLR